MQGRSPTCYSPVRHSSTPERAFPFDLHVLSTPPAFVLSQNQTLQTKTPGNKPRKNPNQKNPITARHQKLASQTSTPKREKEVNKKQQQTKTTKHTIEFSNNTPARAAQLAPRQKPRTRRADDQEPTEVGHFPLGAAALFGPGPCRSDESTSYVRENSESNGLIGRAFRLHTYRAHHGASAPTRCSTPRSQKLFPTAKSRPKPLAPTAHPRRSTPAIFRLPRRSTSQRPCKKSAGCGTHSSLSIRTLLT